MEAPLPSQGYLIRTRVNCCSSYRWCCVTGGLELIGGIILGTIIFGIAKEAFFYIPGIDGSFYRVFLGAVLVTAALTNENIRKRIMGNI